MQSANQSTKHANQSRWTYSGRIFITVIFLLSVVVSSARADTTTPTPNNPSEPNATTANVLSTSIFGVQMYPMNNQGGLNSWIQNTPTRWIRGPEILWKNVEAVKGTYDWNGINQAVTDIQNANTVNSGASIIVVVRSAPDWAQANPPYSCGPIKPTEYQSFANFMFALIGRLNSLGITYVKYWEFWNEPDNPPVSPSDPDQPWGGCWGDINDAYFGGGAYGNMLKTIYPTIKSKDPNAQVLVGGLNLDCDPRYPPPAGHTDCNSAKFLEGILQAGAGSSFDGISFHAFDYVVKDQNGTYLLGQFYNPNWPGAAWNQSGPSLVAKSMFIKSVLQKYNVTGKYLMNTENSLLDAPYSTLNNPYPPILETTKSFYLARAYAAAAANGLKANIWFDVTGTWERNNGLVKLDNSEALDAYSAYIFASNQAGNPDYPAYTGKFYYVGGLSYPGISGYEFAWYPVASQPTLQPFHIWFLWSNDGLSHTIKFNFVTPAVYDVKGNVVFQNIQELTIFSQPYYVVAPMVVGRGRLPLSMVTDFNGNFAWGFDKWTINNSGLPTSLQTTNPVDPQDPTGKTKDTYVPDGYASALLGNSSYGLGQSKGNCQFSNIPAPAYAGLDKYVTIPYPPVGQHVTVSFDYIIYSQDRTGIVAGKKYDSFDVFLTDMTAQTPTPVQIYTDGNKAYTDADQCRWYRVPSVENPGPNGETSGWANKSFVADSYQGKVIKLSFHNYNGPDGWYNTYTYIDNLTVTIGP